MSSQTIVEYAGTIAFAISVALLAGQRRMNVVGVVTFSVLVAIGSGTSRDVLLGELPVYRVDDPAAVPVVPGQGAARRAGPSGPLP